MQRAEEFHLHGRRDIADFVEEERTAIGILELADLAGVRAGESALFVSEEFGLDQRFGNGRAVDRDEAVILAGTVVMQGGGDEFFTRSGLTANQDGGVDARELVDDAEDFLRSRCFDR